MVFFRICTRDSDLVTVICNFVYSEFSTFSGVPKQRSYGQIALFAESDAVILKLVQTDHCGKDEYYIQSVDDGQYLTIKYAQELWYGYVPGGIPMRSDPRLELLYFQDYQSEATVFRFRLYHHQRHRVDEWIRRLMCGLTCFIPPGN